MQPCSPLQAWFAAGIRVVDPGMQFAVVEGTLGPWITYVSAGSRLALAPPGAFRLTLYPVHAVVLPLPGAEEAMLPSVDGSRYGLKGSATIRHARHPGRAARRFGDTDEGLDGGVVVRRPERPRRSFSDADRDDRAVSTRTLAFRAATCAGA